MRRSGEMMLVTLMLGACTTAAEMEGARPATEARAQCRVYAKPLEHPGRMFDACLISKGYVADYSTVAGQVKVRSAKLPAQPPEQIAKDLKGCNDAGLSGWGTRDAASSSPASPRVAIRPRAETDDAALALLPLER